MVKEIVKSSLRAMGVKVSRIDPAEENKYLWLRSHDIRTVLDVGANVGQYAKLIHGVLPEARILSFEPLKDCYEELRGVLATLPSAQALNYALGEEEGEAEIHRSEYAPSSSLLPMGEKHKEWVPYSSKTHIETIKVQTLDGVAPTLDLQDNLMIKIDVQGFEDRVIRGGRETVRRARVLAVETSFEILYEGQPLFEEVFDLVRPLGFRYYGSFEQYRAKQDGRLYQADSIFLHESAFPGSRKHG